MRTITKQEQLAIPESCQGALNFPKKAVNRMWRTDVAHDHVAGG
ncbi:hypothetical protein BH24BAC1_BH24BAC1_37570 [soil metagenome]